MPWRVAFALQEDGWYLRSDIIWCKPNPMPESVRDRPTNAHEYLFLLSKSPRYYFDQEAIAEWGTSGPSDVRKMAEQRERIGGRYKDAEDPLMAASALTNVGRRRAVGRVERIPANWATGPGAHPQFAPGREHQNGEPPPSMEGLRTRRNKRSWWVISTEAYPGAHFATFPQALVEPCILAGCPPGGVVLDPFVGSGTVAYVAHRLGRRAIGIDASPEYIELARRRLESLPVGTLL